MRDKYAIALSSVGGAEATLRSAGLTKAKLIKLRSLCQKRVDDEEEERLLANIRRGRASTDHALRGTPKTSMARSTASSSSFFSGGSTTTRGTLVDDHGIVDEGPARRAQALRLRQLAALAG